MTIHNLDEKLKLHLLNLHLCKGEAINIRLISTSMCGDIYVFEYPDHVVPKYTCVKIPKKTESLSTNETNKRFITELKSQLNYYYHPLINWAYDFTDVLETPVALFRYWDGTLRDFINRSNSLEQKLSLMAYLCVALDHCYQKGLITHQDLKPENIFLRDLRKTHKIELDNDIYLTPILGDFGLSNAFKESQVFEGARPYMAPEQWDKKELTQKTDVFSLGIIFYEIMSNGIHPATKTKLNEHWPIPQNGFSKKWTQSKPWKKWSCSEKNWDNLPSIDQNFLNLYLTMTSLEPNKRPAIDSVLQSILSILKNESVLSYEHTLILINHFNSLATPNVLQKEWPYLSKKWITFREKFDKY